MLGLLFENGEYDPARNSFDYIPFVNIKYINSLIDNKQFFEQSIRNK